MKKLKILIQGMHCASCASNVEKSLRRIEGVKNASVSLLMKKGNVECEDSVPEKEIKKAVARAGYKCFGIEKA